MRNADFVKDSEGEWIDRKKKKKEKSWAQKTTVAAGTGSLKDAESAACGATKCHNEVIK